MRHFLIYLLISTFTLFLSTQLFAKSNEAKAKDKCKHINENMSPLKCKADKRICPYGWYAHTKYKKDGTDWSACIERKSKSKWNKKLAEKACESATANGLVGCTVWPKQFCPTGWFHILHVRGEGENHSACLMRGAQIINKVQKMVKGLKDLGNSLETNFTKMAINYDEYIN